MIQATGNYTHNVNNRVNNPVAYILFIFSIFFQSVCFYSHYFGKTPSVNADNGFFINQSMNRESIL